MKSGQSLSCECIFTYKQALGTWKACNYQKFLKVASQMSDQLDGWTDMPPVKKPNSILL